MVRWPCPWRATPKGYALALQTGLCFEAAVCAWFLLGGDLLIGLGVIDVIWPRWQVTWDGSVCRVAGTHTQGPEAAFTKVANFALVLPGIGSC
jgi:hypothetical protein